MTNMTARVRPFTEAHPGYPCSATGARRLQL